MKSNNYWDMYEISIMPCLLNEPRFFFLYLSKFQFDLVEGEGEIKDSIKPCFFLAKEYWNEK